MSLLESPGPSRSRFVEVEGANLHYLEAGPETGSPVILLHGWPTSAFLWRKVIPAVAERRRVIALDLPGFGRSDKPLDVSYSFRYYRRVLDGFYDHLGSDQVGLAVHDLGGPVGLYWAVQDPKRIERLAVLNTLVYPDVSWAVKAFAVGCRLPGARGLLTSQWGLKQALHLGVCDSRALDEDAVAGLQEPFVDGDARTALLKAGTGMHPKGLAEVARGLKTFDFPVRLIYGAEDKILPDIARTMERLKADIPHAELTELSGCGHFLQEERPEEVGRLLAEFFAPPEDVKS